MSLPYLSLPSPRRRPSHLARVGYTFLTLVVALPSWSDLDHPVPMPPPSSRLLPVASRVRAAYCYFRPHTPSSRTTARPHWRSCDCTSKAQSVTTLALPDHCRPHNDLQMHAPSCHPLRACRHFPISSCNDARHVPRFCRVRHSAHQAPKPACINHSWYVQAVSRLVPRHHESTRSVYLPTAQCQRVTAAFNARTRRLGVSEHPLPPGRSAAGGLELKPPAPSDTSGLAPA